MSFAKREPEIVCPSRSGSRKSSMRTVALEEHTMPKGPLAVIGQNEVRKPSRRHTLWNSELSPGPRGPTPAIPGRMNFGGFRAKPRIQKLPMNRQAITIGTTTGPRNLGYTPRRSIGVHGGQEASRRPARDDTAGRIEIKEYPIWLK